MVYIDKFEFDISSLSEIKSLEHDKTRVGENWPIVYNVGNFVYEIDEVSKKVTAD